MSFCVEIRPDALADVESAAEWYEQRQAGLGEEYVAAVCGAIASLAEGALHHQIRNRRLRVRWLLAQRFPYRVVYRVDGERVTVLAVLRAARRHREWQRRA